MLPPRPLEEILSERFDFDQPELVSAYDELPLWSAPFGLALLDAVRLRPGIRALDIGFGTGFPLLELAQRLGPGSQVSGVDPWAAATERARAKLRCYGISNVEMVTGVAERLPFPDGQFQLVVSNNGLNNVQDPAQALAECRRVAAPRAQLVFTANLPETMQELYDVFGELLDQAGQGDRREALARHIASRRPTRAAWEGLVRGAGLRVDRVVEQTFWWRFASGSALLRHGFIRLGFLDGWKGVLAGEDVVPFFTRLEERLDQVAVERGGLALRIPFACYDCSRP